MSTYADIGGSDADIVELDGSSGERQDVSTYLQNRGFAKIDGLQAIACILATHETTRQSGQHLVVLH